MVTNLIFDSTALYNFKNGLILFFSSKPRHRLAMLDGQLFHSQVTDESYTQLHLRLREYNSCPMNSCFCPFSTTSYIPRWGYCQQTHSIKILYFLDIKVNVHYIYFWPLLSSHLFFNTR